MDVFGLRRWWSLMHIATFASWRAGGGLGGLPAGARVAANVLPIFRKVQAAGKSSLRVSTGRNPRAMCHFESQTTAPLPYPTQVCRGLP